MSTSTHAFQCAALAAVLFLAPAVASAKPAAPPASGSHAQREAATKAKLAEVRAAIAKLAVAQHATDARRDAINAKLATQATQLDRAANAVHATDAAIAAKESSLATLERERDGIAANLHRQRAALADLLRAAYTLNRGTNLAMLLGDDDIAKIDRALAYSRYFQHDRVARIRELLDQVARLDKVSASIKAETAALDQQRTQRVSQVAALKQARDAQAALLADANRKAAQQKDKLAALQHDASALDKLLKQLQNVFADIPPELGKNTPFTQLRGKLAWPVAGDPRRGAGVLAQGVVIAARPGAEVHAVAYGRVAWANFMRGYGILVIIDHGGGWMSLYGGNESASVAAGDWVKAGQPIATVARNSEVGGAWFGLRHDGHPVDLKGWFSSRH